MEVIPGIHWIEGINCNVYAIDGPEVAFIDTGMKGNAKKMLGYLTETMGRKPSDVKYIFLTHCHLDHIGSAAELRAATGAKLLAHVDDAEYISRKRIPPVPKGGMGLLFRLLGPLIRVKPFEIDGTLRDGDVVSGLKVVHVPGHTPGSIALYDARRKVLFAGDTLRYACGKVGGPPERFTLDAVQAHKSIERLKALDFDVLLGGHGEPLVGGAAKKVRELKL